MTRAVNLKAGMMVMHSGEFHEVADVEIRPPLVRVATMSGGHVAFTTSCRVTISKEEPTE